MPTRNLEGVRRDGLALLGVVALAPALAAAQSTDPTAYVLLARDAMRVTRLEIDAAAGGHVGVVGSRGTLGTRILLNAPGYEVSAPTVRLAGQARCGALFGDDVRGATATCGPAADWVQPFDDLRAACDFPAPFPRCAGPAVTVPDGETHVLWPGTYGDLKITGRGGKVVLAGEGQYRFCDVDVSRGSRIEAAARTEVFVTGTVKTGTGASIVPAPGGVLDAPDLRLVVAGSSVRFSRKGAVTAHVCAPDADLDATSASLVGRFVAKSLRAKRVKARVRLVSTTTTSSPAPTTSTVTTTTTATTTTTVTTTTTTTTLCSDACGIPACNPVCDPANDSPCGALLGGVGGPDAGSCAGAIIGVECSRTCAADCNGQAYERCPATTSTTTPTTTSTLPPSTSTTSTPTTSTTDACADACGRPECEPLCDPEGDSPCGALLGSVAGPEAGSCAGAMIGVQCARTCAGDCRSEVYTRCSTSTTATPPTSSTITPATSSTVGPTTSTVGPTGTTSTTLGALPVPELCGNCIDDDGDGDVDLADDDCCAATNRFAGTVRRAKVRPRGDTHGLRLRSVLADGGLALDGRRDQVSLVMTRADGGPLLCATVPAGALRKVGRGWRINNKRAKLESLQGIDVVRLKQRRNGQLRFRVAGKRVRFGDAAVAGTVDVTVGFRDPAADTATNRCARAAVAMRAVRGGKLRYP